MNAVFLDYGTMGASDLDLSRIESTLPGLQLFDTTPASNRVERIRDAEVILCNKTRLDADVLSEAASLRFIGVAATGTDNVDLGFATENGIAVCNLVAYCTQSVVEHVFALLLNLTHNVRPYHDLVRAGSWRKAKNFCMLDYPNRELSGMTMGIVGHGVLGAAVARTARHFNMNVIVSGRPGTKVDGDRCELHEVLQQSDVVTLHCPLTDETRDLVDTSALDIMKSDAILINTARGALVNSAALVQALGRDEIGAAAIDVLAQEPPINGDPLLDYDGDNLIITPHVAWSTREARQNAIDELAANYTSFVEGGSRNRIV